jgi:gamma-glutamylcyclotransferase (GGCT)/AIG2-like uncharacterized protein YtfP
MTGGDGNVLFVYGTLRAGTQHEMSRALREHARLLGEGTVCARLYDLGDYPGMLLDHGDDDGDGGRVRGELYALDADAADRTWRMLEEYENPPEEGPAEFVRTRVHVDVAGGIVTAWAYVLIALPRDAHVIDSGDWLDHRSSAGV